MTPDQTGLTKAGYRKAVRHRAGNLMLTLVCVSDTHGRHRDLTVPPGDVFLFAGDLSNHGRADDVSEFDDWLGTLPHPHKVIICGNHDFHFERDPADARRRITHAAYLQDSGTEIAGLKVWGSPWQPRFFDWAFNLDRGPDIAAKWALIPDGTDVLVTHGPPAGVLDQTPSRRLGRWAADLSVAGSKS